MRHLAESNTVTSPEIIHVPMRGKYDCMTCVAAMLIGVKYEEVEKAFGGNIDPSKDKIEEAIRIFRAIQLLFRRHGCAMLELEETPLLRRGRRYWVGVHIDDPTNSLSKDMSHSIAVDEDGRVFDPNPQYGSFDSFQDWSAAMSLPHEIQHATEVFEFLL